MTQHPATASSWFMPPPNLHIARLRLFCFPYAGGGTWIFRNWPSRLGPAIAVCPVKLPGRADRFQEAPITNLHALADTLAVQLAPWLHEPYAFFGCSLGALLAFESTCRLIAAGIPPPERLVVAASAAPALAHQKEELLHRLPDRAFIEAVRTRFANPFMSELDEEVLPLVLPALRGDITMYETYRPRPDTPPLPVPVTVMGGRQDRIPAEDLQAWQNHTTRPIDVHLFDGGHFFIHEQEAALIKPIAFAFQLQY